MVVLSITQRYPALCLCGHYSLPEGIRVLKPTGCFCYTLHIPAATHSDYWRVYCCSTDHMLGGSRWTGPCACINIFQWLSLSHFKDGLPHVSLMQPPYKSLQYSIPLKISLGTRIREAAWNRFTLLPSDKCPVYGQNVCCIAGMLKTQHCPYLMVLFSLKFCFESLFCFSAMRSFCMFP